MAELAEMGPMPFAREILESLKECGARMAVVSASSHDWVDGWLERLGLGGYFETTVCRGDAARIKPAPDFYLEAARRLGVDPARSLAD